MGTQPSAPAFGGDTLTNNVGNSLGQMEMLKPAPSEDRAPRELSWELSAQVRIS